jgi:hypothetical protein
VVVEDVEVGVDVESVDVEESLLGATGAVDKDETVDVEGGVDDGVELVEDAVVELGVDEELDVDVVDVEALVEEEFDDVDVGLVGETTGVTTAGTVEGIDVSAAGAGAIGPLAAVEISLGWKGFAAGDNATKPLFFSRKGDDFLKTRASECK